MKALVYHGPGQKSWDSVPDPGILEPTGRPGRERAGEWDGASAAGQRLRRRIT